MTDDFRSNITFLKKGSDCLFKVYLVCRGMALLHAYFIAKCCAGALCHTILPYNAPSCDMEETSLCPTQHINIELTVAKDTHLSYIP